MKSVAVLFKLSLGDLNTETLALSVGLALVLGVFPMYGIPTLLCGAAAILLRLNMPAMQLVNLVTSPLQIALLIPFHRVGSLILRSPVLRFGAGSTPAAASAAHAPVRQFVTGFFTLTLHAIAGWFCICVPLAILLYLVSRLWILVHRLRTRLVPAGLLSIFALLCNRLV